MLKLNNGNTKTCNKCQIPKTLECFAKNPKHRDGLQYRCKDCDLIYRASYALKNQEKIKKGRKNYYESNREELKEKYALYRKINRETINKAKREHKQRAKIRDAESQPLKLVFADTKNRSKRRKQSFEISLDFLNSLWEKQVGRCYYSNLPMNYTYSKKDPFQVSIDRRDSTKGYTEENSVLCCLSINYAKNSFTEEQLRDFLQHLK